MTDQNLQHLIDRILTRAEKELGYSVGGYRVMLNTMAKTRPNDFRKFLQIVIQEAAGVNL